MKSIRMMGMLALIASAGACRDSIVDNPATPATPPGQTPAEAGQPRIGYIWGRDGQPMRVTYEVRHGRAIFEGDIDIGADGSVPATPEALRRAGTHGPRYGVAVTGSSNLWGGGVVPYVVDPNLYNPSRVTAAIAAIEAKNNGIDFVARTNQTDYVYITTQSGTCTSPVGRKGGMQTVKLDPTGCPTGAVIHELSHSLGMWHEQSRCDRDSYVQILTANIITSELHNFDKHCTGAEDILSYDEGSIMHYDRYAFTSNGQPTINSLRGLNALMGQRDSLSTTDVNTLKHLYRPNSPYVYGATNSGGSPAFSWTAVAGATEYEVTLVYHYEENDYERGTTINETRTPLGSVTGTSFTDTGMSYTGTSFCMLYYDAYNSTWDEYKYEVKAVGPAWSTYPYTIAAPVNSGC